MNVSLSSIRYDNQYSPSTPRTTNRADQERPPDVGPAASGQPYPAIQRLRQDRLPLQGPDTSAPARPLLQGQLRLPRQVHLPIRPSPRSQGSPRRIGELQTDAEADRSVGGISDSPGQRKTAVGCLTFGQNLSLSSLQEQASYPHIGADGSWVLSHKRTL